MTVCLEDAELRVQSLKKRGNDAFVEGSRHSTSENGQNALRAACVLYGQAIEVILELESQVADRCEDPGLSDAVYEAFVILRPLLFLNLAVSNLKLNAADGALRCCNSALQLCNTPGLLFTDLAASEENVDVLHPIAESMEILITKALYRRGKCFDILGNLPLAVEDYLIAGSISPNNKEVKEALLSALKRRNIELDANLDRDRDEAHSFNDGESMSSARANESPLIEPTLPLIESTEGMTVNGGRCWMRRACWSQTVLDASMYIPVEILYTQLSKKSNIDGANVDDLDNEDSSRISRSSSSRIGRSSYNGACKKWKINFTSLSVVINNIKENSSTVLSLEHLIISHECTWTMDQDSNMIVLHFIKGPSFDWFPGQEWWDRVCIGDEAIDTTCCSIGADTSELPLQARERAEKENHRFHSLSESDRLAEISHLTRVRKEMEDSYLRTAQAVKQEDAAVEEVPERAAMLEAMRKEFPTIDITAR